MVRVAVMCDIGQDVFHVGDEAIAHATVARLSERGITPVLLTRDVEATKRDFGDVKRHRTWVFPQLPVDRERYLGEIRAVLRGETDALPEHDQIFALIELAKLTDALLIAGGGNLNSTYGWLMYERAAMALIYRELGKPVVITGQTLGPDLSVRDEGVLVELLNNAALVGVRDLASVRLANRIAPDVNVSRVFDDATLLPEPETPAEVGELASLATLSFATGAYPSEQLVAPFAALLDVLAEQAGPVSMLPHMGVLGAADGDAGYQALVAERMRQPVRQLDLLPTLQAAEVGRRAQAVFSTRFHPFVFGLDAGAALLPVYADPYSQVRIDGALRNWGLPGLGVNLALLWAARNDQARMADLGEWLRHNLALRPQLAEQVERVRPEVSAHIGNWWDRVATAVAGEGDGQPLDFPQLPQLELSAAPLTVAGAQLRAAPRPEDAEPSVAIIMRTKNRPALLARGLDDVLAQTWADWQLVVVNDGGDPEPVDALIAERADQWHDRLQVLHHPESLGMEAASNAGLAATRSRYVTVHDDDDTWQPSFLQRCVEYLEGPGADEAGVAVRINLIHEHQEGERFVIDEVRPYWHELSEFLLLDLLKVNRSVPIAVLYRRSLHEDIGGYDESLPAVGDWEFYLRALLKHDFGFISDTVLAQWHQRPDASGADANSVNIAADRHRHFDARVREEALKRWIDDNGPGLPLYLTKMTEREINSLRPAQDQLKGDVEALARQVDQLRESLDRLHRRLDELGGSVEHSAGTLDQLMKLVADNSLFGYVKRKYRRVVLRQR